MGLDLSYLEALMGGSAAEQPATGTTGGVWVVAVVDKLDDGLLRLIGKARVLADALGAYVYVLARDSDPEAAERAIRAGADQVWLAQGEPTLADLTTFFEPRQPQVILFPRTQPGRSLAAGLAQRLDGGLCGHAADLEVDPIYQRIVAHQPVLDDAARQRVTILAAPAVAIVDTAMLPAAFNEPWRSGTVTDARVNWAVPAERRPTAWPQPPVTLTSAAIVVAGGRGLKTKEGFALARQLARALGGAVGGDLAALDAGWIAEEELIGLTGARVAPKLLLALGLDGDTSLFMSIQDAGLIVAVQPDPSAPIVPVADYNLHADPADFAQVLLDRLART